VDRCGKALGEEKVLIAGGGVSLNSRLRERLKGLADERGIELLLAAPSLCGDNAAMIAGLAGAGGGIRGDSTIEMDVVPNLGLI
jgi:tRNA A37 threonylcarbamoyltransferase TsaD